MAITPTRSPSLTPSSQTEGSPQRPPSLTLPPLLTAGESSTTLPQATPGQGSSRSSIEIGFRERNPNRNAGIFDPATLNPEWIAHFTAQADSTELNAPSEPDESAGLKTPAEQAEQTDQLSPMGGHSRATTRESITSAKSSAGKSSLSLTNFISDDGKTTREINKQLNQLASLYGAKPELEMFFKTALLTTFGHISRAVTNNAELPYAPPVSLLGLKFKGASYLSKGAVAIPAVGSVISAAIGTAISETNQNLANQQFAKLRRLVEPYSENGCARLAHTLARALTFSVAEADWKDFADSIKANANQVKDTVAGTAKTTSTITYASTKSVEYVTEILLNMSDKKYDGMPQPEKMTAAFETFFAKHANNNKNFDTIAIKQAIELWGAPHIPSDKLEVDSSVTFLHNTINGLRAEVRGLESKVGSLESKVGSLESKVGSLESKVDELQTTLANQSTDFNNQLTAMQTAMTNQSAHTNHQLDLMINMMANLATNPRPNPQ